MSGSDGEWIYLPEEMSRRLPAILVNHLRDEDKTPEDDDEEPPEGIRHAVMPISSAMMGSETGYAGAVLRYLRGGEEASIAIKAGMPVVSNDPDSYAVCVSYSSDDPRVPQEALDALATVFRPIYRLDWPMFRPLPITAGLTIAPGDRKRGEFSYTCHLDMTEKGRPCGLISAPTGLIEALEEGRDDDVFSTTVGPGSYILPQSVYLDDYDRDYLAPVRYSRWTVWANGSRSDYRPLFPEDVWNRYKQELFYANQWTGREYWAVFDYYSDETTSTGTWSYNTTIEQRGIVSGSLAFQADMYGENIDLRLVTDPQAWNDRGLATPAYNFYPVDTEYELRDPEEYPYPSYGTPEYTLEANPEPTRCQSVTNSGGNENNYLGVPAGKPTTPSGEAPTDAQSQLVGITLTSSRGQRVYNDGMTINVSANGYSNRFYQAREVEVANGKDIYYTDIDWQWLKYTFSRTRHYFVADTYTIAGTSIIFPIVDPGLVSSIKFYFRPRRTTAAGTSSSSSSLEIYNAKPSFTERLAMDDIPTEDITLVESIPVASLPISGQGSGNTMVRIDNPHFVIAPVVGLAYSAMCFRLVFDSDAEDVREFDYSISNAGTLSTINSASWSATSDSVTFLSTQTGTSTVTPHADRYYYECFDADGRMVQRNIQFDRLSDAPPSYWDTGPQ